MKHSLPLVSIVIPTYNEEKNIERCLASILNQNYPQDLLEVIVVDNYSTNGTVEKTRKYKAVLLQRGNERNIQRNIGAKKSKGSYLMFIDADMELEKRLVREAVEKCVSEGYDAVILPEISVGQGFWANCRKLEKECYLGDELMETPNRFIKKDAYQDVGGYDVNLIAGEDFDLGDRLKKKGYKIGRVDAFIRHHEVRSFAQMIRKHFYYGKEMRKYFKKSRMIGVKRFFIVRPAYLRNWRLFVRDPVHGLGLIIMKFFQYVAGSLGLLSSIVFAKKDSFRISEGAK